MKPRFVDEFEEREFYANRALIELKRLYPDKFKYEIHFTPLKHTFDAFWSVLDKNGSVIKRVWVEMKIRDKDWDEGYMLEMKKVKQINKLKKELYLNSEDVRVLYINFTPSKTLIWDISHFNEEDDFNSTLKANKATALSRTNKVNKSCTYLLEENGYKLDFILNKEQLNNIYYNEYYKEKVEKKIKTNKGLEDILFS